MSKIIDGQYGPMHLKTNYQWRELFALEDARVPEKERADFDYIEGEDRHSTRLFNYRGSWYDSHEFTIAPDSVKRIGFDGIQSESAFSAVILRYYDDEGYYHDDEIIVGYIHW